ncbi:MAG: carbon storage regulator [Gammaproteobacteria bacterium]|nr:carbon storage regulator [Gammaproteobacteria bacterium]
MLIVSRKVKQSLCIALDPTIDPKTPIGEIFARGPIRVVVACIEDTYVRLGISAHPGLAILREELHVFPEI